MPNLHKFFSVLIILVILSGVGWYLYQGYETRQAAQDANIQQIGAYLQLGITEGIFPSGQTLSQIAAQRASSTK